MYRWYNRPSTFRSLVFLYKETSSVSVNESPDMSFKKVTALKLANKFPEKTYVILKTVASPLKIAYEKDNFHVHSAACNNDGILSRRIAGARILF